MLCLFGYWYGVGARQVAELAPLCSVWKLVPAEMWALLHTHMYMRICS